MSDQDHTTTSIIHSQESTWESVIELATNAVRSPRSKANYRIALTEFFRWRTSKGNPPVTKALVNEYKTMLHDDKKLAAATINLKLSAIRKLVSEAADNGLIDEQTASSVKKVKGAEISAQKQGKWLSLDQARQLVNKPNITTKKGLRDRAILAVLVGAALRRDECARLTVESFQMIDGGWALPDYIGKREKARTITISAWVKQAVDAWTDAAGITSGPIWRGMRKGDHIDQLSGNMSTQAIWRVVTEYCAALGFGNVAPHDLRRTAAKIMHKNDGRLDQISQILGHASLTTTQKYLGLDLDTEHPITNAINITLDLNPQRIEGM